MRIDGLFDEDCGFDTGPPLTDAMVADAERRLGVRLPSSYVRLLRHRNGGSLLRVRCPTPFATSWAEDHFAVRSIYGIGGDRGIDSRFGSAYLIEEWDYPRIGVVVAACPSGGHDLVMLDYTRPGPDGEPSIAYIDEGLPPRTVADGFGEFIEALLPE